MGGNTSGIIGASLGRSGRYVGLPFNNRLLIEEYQCTTAENYLVAHYDLKPLDVKAYDVSGNNFIIYESFQHLTPGEFASFLPTPVLANLYITWAT